MLPILYKWTKKETIAFDKWREIIYLYIYIYLYVKFNINSIHKLTFKLCLKIHYNSQNYRNCSPSSSE